MGISVMAAREPRIEKKGNSWEIAYQDGNQAIEITPEKQGESVSIFKCTNSTIQIKGKCTVVSLNSCTSVGVVCSDVIASVEAANSSKVQLQITGHAPTVQLDNVSGAALFVERAQSEKIDFVTANTTEVTSISLLVMLTLKKSMFLNNLSANSSMENLSPP